jgi:hypothetical protein
MTTLHLVVDEVVPIARHRFRVRVWRRTDSQPLVLLSQVQRHPPPDWCSSRLANLVFRSFLGYSQPLPNFFEVSHWNGQVRAFRVRFETIGYQLRPILLNPMYEPIHPQVIEHVFRRKPDTYNRKEHPRGKTRIDPQAALLPCALRGDRRYPPAPEDSGPASGSEVQTRGCQCPRSMCWRS